MNLHLLTTRVASSYAPILGQVDALSLPRYWAITGTEFSFDAVVFVVAIKSNAVAVIIDSWKSSLHFSIKM